MAPSFQGFRSAVSRKLGGSGGEGGTDASHASKKAKVKTKPPSFNDYRNREKIGQGAFATVYYAHEPESGQAVALKKINLDAIEDKMTLETTMKELELFKQLDHPHIVRCYKAFEESETLRYANAKVAQKNLILVLEYVDGGDLERWLTYLLTHGVRLVEEKLIWHLFEQVADSLRYIHERRIIHRDLKPANVLLTRQFHVKLTDFGLSKQNRNTGAKTVCGTPYYMAPERIAERGYSFKSDVWSLGCILYEMAALASPFYGEKENITSLVEKIRAPDYPPVPDYDDRYSKQLLMLIDACLDPCAVDRPTANEVHSVAFNMKRRFYPPPSLPSSSTITTDASAGYGARRGGAAARG